MTTDVRELLAQAAAKPASELDVAALVRTARRRRRVRAVCAGAVTVAVAAVAVVVWLPGVDRDGIQTPARPVPTTVPTLLPDVSKTHALVVTPSTGLRDRQLVRVSGRFAPPIGAENDIVVQICRVGVTPLTAGNDCDGSTTQYSRIVKRRTLPLRRYPYMVRRRVSIGFQPVDCAAPPGCVLYAASRFRRLYGTIYSRYRDKYGVAPIAFGPTASPWPGPTVTVTPDHGLRDGDSVTVRAHHLRPFQGVGVTVCSYGTDVCDAVDVAQRRIGPNGSRSLTYRVWSVFSSDGTLHDCRSVVCVVRFGSSDGSRGGSITDVPISFSARKRAAPSPQLSLDPAGPYTDGQQVTVTVNGWPGSIGRRPELAIEHVTVGQCAPSPGPRSIASCGGELTSLRREPDGRYTATLALHRTGSIEFGTTDCAQPGNCQVALVRSPDANWPPTVILGVDFVVT